MHVDEFSFFSRLRNPREQITMALNSFFAPSCSVMGVDGGVFFVFCVCFVSFLGWLVFLASSFQVGGLVMVSSECAGLAAGRTHPSAELWEKAKTLLKP